MDTNIDKAQPVTLEEDSFDIFIREWFDLIEEIICISMQE